MWTKLDPPICMHCDSQSEIGKAQSYIMVSLDIFDGEKLF
jgi:hypothetical protein